MYKVCVITINQLKRTPTTQNRALNTVPESFWNGQVT